MITSSQIQLDSYPFQLTTFTGTVIEVRGKTVTSTTIQGGEILSDGYGNLKTKPITSTIHRDDETTLFVKSADGTEKSFNLINWGVEVRQGHQVTISSLTSPKKASLVHIINHNMNTQDYSHLGINIVARKPISKSEWRPILKSIVAFLIFNALSFLIGVSIGDLAILGSVILVLVSLIVALHYLFYFGIRKTQQNKAQEYAKIISQATLNSLTTNQIKIN